MDFAEALNRKQNVYPKAPVNPDEIPELTEEEKKAILAQLLTRGRYCEEVVIVEDPLYTVEFCTRTAAEDLEVRQAFESDGIPQLMTDFLFKLGLYSLVYSLKKINGQPVQIDHSKPFKERAMEIAQMIPSPLLTKVLQEFSKFEIKVLQAIDPTFLQRLRQATRPSGQESNTSLPPAGNPNPGV
jgi:hypothetical protein